jgi:subtilisin family serine protease
MNTPNEFESRLSKADPAKKRKAPGLSAGIVRAATKSTSRISAIDLFRMQSAKLKALTVGGAVSGVAAIAAVSLVVTMSPQPLAQMASLLQSNFNAPWSNSDVFATGDSKDTADNGDNSAGSGNNTNPGSSGSNESAGSDSAGSTSASGEIDFTNLDVNSVVASGETALQSFVAEGEQASPGTSNYIIVFKPAANIDREIRGIGAINAGVGPKFQNVFKGVMARLTERQLAALSRNPNISFIEKDAKVSLVEPSNVTNQLFAPWGLDRIDQVTGRDTTYTYTATGSGVTAYVIDTGILASHSEFGGRVLSGFSSISGGTSDCNGHGTHVAGTIGAATFGVAKAVSLVPVRVLDCNGSGTVSGVIAGIDWVSSQATGGLRVANMSLGGVASSAIDTAVNALIGKGVTVVVAAGNNSADACNYSPARVPAAITVAASTSSDGFASYSNRGSCVDIVAPGTSIQSAWHTSTTASNTISGTSMASPHVAGAVALYFQKFGAMSPVQMDQQLKSRASLNVISSVPNGTANIFLFTAPQITSSPTPSEPTVSPTPEPSPTPTVSPSPSPSPSVSPSPSPTKPGKSGKNPRRP